MTDEPFTILSIHTCRCTHKCSNYTKVNAFTCGYRNMMKYVCTYAYLTFLNYIVVALWVGCWFQSVCDVPGFHLGPSSSGGPRQHGD
jgi:hypothetical protein